VTKEHSHVSFPVEKRKSERTTPDGKEKKKKDRLKERIGVVQKFGAKSAPN